MHSLFYCQLLVSRGWHILYNVHCCDYQNLTVSVFVKISKRVRFYAICICLTEKWLLYFYLKKFQKKKCNVVASDVIESDAHLQRIWCLSLPLVTLWSINKFKKFIFVYYSKVTWKDSLICWLVAIKFCLLVSQSLVVSQRWGILNGYFRTMFFANII